MSAAGYKPDWTDAMRSGELDPGDGIVSAQRTPGLRVEPRWEKVGGADEVAAWEVWDGDEWLDTFDNEGDAIDYRAAIAITKQDPQ